MVLAESSFTCSIIGQCTLECDSGPYTCYDLVWTTVILQSPTLISTHDANFLLLSQCGPHIDYLEKIMWVSILSYATIDARYLFHFMTHVDRKLKEN